MTISRFSFGWVGAMIMALFNLATCIGGLFNHPFGLDIGFELGVIFAGTAYFFLRRIELNKNRR